MKTHICIFLYLNEKENDTNMPVGIFFLSYIAFLVISTILFTQSQRGMCRWTVGDGLVLTWMKQLLNAMTGWILGIALQFALPEPCNSLKMKQRHEDPVSESE